MRVRCAESRLHRRGQFELLELLEFFRSGLSLAYRQPTPAPRRRSSNYCLPTTDLALAILPLFVTLRQLGFRRLVQLEQAAVNLARKSVFPGAGGPPQLVVR